MYKFDFFFLYFSQKHGEIFVLSEKFDNLIWTTNIIFQRIFKYILINCNTEISKIKHNTAENI